MTINSDSWDRMEYVDDAHSLIGSLLGTDIVLMGPQLSSARAAHASLAPDMKPAPSAPKRSPSGKARGDHRDSMKISCDDMTGWWFEPL